jgi:hypothetical protein
MLNIRKTWRGRGINPRASSYWCEHDNPIMVNATETGSYYARCLVCLAIGPVCAGPEEAARQALVLLGARGDGVNPIFRTMPIVNF